MFPKPAAVVLQPATSDWTKRWTKAGGRQTTLREAELQAAVYYLKSNAPEIGRGSPGVVGDFGPGGGELLEVCRQLGHEVFGIDDAGDNKGSESADVLAQSRLMHERQNLPVFYEGLKHYLTDPGREQLLSTYGTRCRLINARLSLEQMLSDHLTGGAYAKTQSCKAWEWKIVQLPEVFSQLFDLVLELLVPGGYFLLQLQGAKNTHAAERLLKQTAEHAGFDLRTARDRLLKWQRI